jgi:hypothetical protein
MKKWSTRRAALQAPRMFLEKTVQDLNEKVQGCVAELVFNLDKIGSSDWEDRETKTGVGGDVWSDNTSWSILKCETHFTDCLRVCCWRQPYPLYNDITEFLTGSSAPQKASRAFRKRLDLEI